MKKPAVKKPAVKKPAVKKPAVKKPAVKKPAAEYIVEITTKGGAVGYYAGGLSFDDDIKKAVSGSGSAVKEIAALIKKLFSKEIASARIVKK